MKHRAASLRQLSYFHTPTAIQAGKTVANNFRAFLLS